MKKLVLFATVCLLVFDLRAAERFADRFVWIFGWGLEKDTDVFEITKILETAGHDAAAKGDNGISSAD